MEHVSAQNRLGRTVADIHNDQGELARLLGRVSLGLLVITAVSDAIIVVMAMVGILIADRLFPAVLLSIVLAGAIALATQWLIRKKRYQIATNLFLFSTLFQVTVGIYLIGGVTGPIFISYLIPIMAAGLFGKASDSLRLFIVATIAYAGLGLLQSLDILPPVIELSGVVSIVISLLTFATIGGLSAYLALVWSSSMVHFLGQAKEQSEALFQSNQRLLEKNIQQIELGSELSTAATELLSASHQQASGATEQASAVSEVSTTIEELGSTARQIAIAAEQVAEASRQTLENLSEGQDAVDNSIQAMERIRGRMEDVSTRVLNLGERSQQIGEILDVIYVLSDETHLLALNAAIEAAGAGEHGLRFAVVAAVVKILAYRGVAAD
jgi:methyl-accepting chemotaxis protein